MNVKTAKNRIYLYGNLVFENVEKGKKLLLAALEQIEGNKIVTIDLSRVNEIDSAGIQLLLSFIHSLETLDTEFKIKKMRKELFDLIILSGLNKFFRVKAEEVIGFK